MVKLFHPFASLFPSHEVSSHIPSQACLTLHSRKTFPNISSWGLTHCNYNSCIQIFSVFSILELLNENRNTTENNSSVEDGEDYWESKRHIHEQRHYIEDCKNNPYSKQYKCGIFHRYLFILKGMVLSAIPLNQTMRLRLQRTTLLCSQSKWILLNKCLLTLIWY